MKITRRDFLKTVSSYVVGGFGALVQTKLVGSNRLGDKLPNIIIFVFDALSARQSSVYGYHRQTTPNLARLADKATVYHRHYAAGNFTSPATASLLTGTYPWTHRVFQQRERSKETWHNTTYSN